MKLLCAHLEIRLVKALVYEVLGLRILPIVKSRLEPVFALGNEELARASGLIIHSPYQFLVSLLEVLLILNLLIFFVFGHGVILYLVVAILRPK